MFVKQPIFAEINDNKIDLLIIAGEHSGDEQAARLLRALWAEKPGLKVAAFGGSRLQEVGASLVYDMTSSAVVGFWEVVRHYPFFRCLFDKMLDWIERHQPQHIVLVDYPGFNLRLAKALFEKKLSKKAGGPIGISYYISPQIWAWKANRRFKMAKWIDNLGVIFPFEVACFKDTTLPVVFVGHPFADEAYQVPLVYNKDAPILLLPGSRKTAVKRIFPRMLQGVAEYLKNHPGKSVQVIYPTDIIRRILEKKLRLVPSMQGQVAWIKRQEGSVVEASAILTSSGTMSLNCALAGIPGAIVYVAAPFTYALGRLLIRVRYLGMANLLLNEAVYPEYIQNHASPAALAAELKDCLENPDRLQSAKQASQKLYESLKSLPNSDSSKSLSVGKWLASQL